MGTSSKRSSGPVIPIGATFRRAISPSGRFSSSSLSDTCSSFASSTSSSFCSSPSSSFFHRSSSPTRVNLHGFSSSTSPSVRFSIDRSRSPSRSMTVTPRDRIGRKPNSGHLPSTPKKTCMCSPTTHPGSFRCSLHKNCSNNSSASTYSPNRLNARRSAMTNSLVRIGAVEGDWVKRALAALIRPSSHQQRRRTSFQPRPSRLSIMSKADDL